MTPVQGKVHVQLEAQETAAQAQAVAQAPVLGMLALAPQVLRSQQEEPARRG